MMRRAVVLLSAIACVVMILLTAVDRRAQCREPITPIKEGLPAFLDHIHAELSGPDMAHHGFVDLYMVLENDSLWARGPLERKVFALVNKAHALNKKHDGIFNEHVGEIKAKSLERWPDGPSRIHLAHSVQEDERSAEIAQEKKREKQKVEQEKQEREELVAVNEEKVAMGALLLGGNLDYAMGEPAKGSKDKLRTAAPKKTKPKKVSAKKAKEPKDKKAVVRKTAKPRIVKPKKAVVPKKLSASSRKKSKKIIPSSDVSVLNVEAMQ